MICPKCNMCELKIIFEFDEHKASDKELFICDSCGYTEEI